MINISIITRSALSRLIRHTLWIALLQCLLVGHTIAQSSATDTRTPAGLTPGSPVGSYALSGFDNVNLYNGSLNFRLPLLQVGRARWSVLHNDVAIQQKWRVNHDFAIQGCTGRIRSWWTWIRPGYGPGGDACRRQTHEGCGDGGPSPGGELQTGSMTTLTLPRPTEREYELRDELNGGID